jgi:hypothetical protein
MRSIVVAAALAIGCGGASPPAPAAPAAPAEPAPSAAQAAAPAAADPFAVPGPLREDEWKPWHYEPIATPLGPAPKGLAPAPAACNAFATRKPAGKIKCDLGGGWTHGQPSPGLLGMLDAALAEADAAKRDALLADVEKCDPALGVAVRALRAELAPHECADVIAAPLVGKPADPEDQNTLAGLAFAARLLRAADKPPHLDPPYDAKRVMAFIKGPLKDWMVAQAKLIEVLSADAARLQGYGQGVAAIEAGIADLRFVDAARGVPVPDTIAKDAELKTVYESQLDQMLEPRKDRGRDAALAGLKVLAQLGILKDERVTRARALLGKLYAGRRIDALDVLVLPPRTASASRLPPYFVFAFGAPADDLDSAFLPPARARVKKEAAARARIEMAKLYWRAVDVDEAIAAAKGKSPEAQLYLALALALRGGPEDAAQMMRKPPPEGLGIGDVRALDALVAGGSAYADIAAFDAAWVKRVGAPRVPSAGYWQDVGARFHRAADLAKNAELKGLAQGAAREADDIAAQGK